MAISFSNDVYQFLYYTLMLNLILLRYHSLVNSLKAKTITELLLQNGVNYDNIKRWLYTRLKIEYNLV